MAEFGASSVAFVLYVFGKAYEGDGYFLTWDKDERLLAAEAIQKPHTYVSEVLQGCLSRSIFDDRVFQMFGVLTSRGIQRRYLETDLVEVTAHLGARNKDGPNGWENHAAWQGRCTAGARSRGPPEAATRILRGPAVTAASPASAGPTAATPIGPTSRASPSAPTPTPSWKP